MLTMFAFFFSILRDTLIRICRENQQGGLGSKRLIEEKKKKKKRKKKKKKGKLRGY